MVIYGVIAEVSIGRLFLAGAFPGILLAVARELKVPIRLVAVGEGVEDIDDFRAGDFVRALLGDPTP